MGFKKENEKGAGWKREMWRTKGTVNEPGLIGAVSTETLVFPPRNDYFSLPSSVGQKKERPPPVPNPDYEVTGMEWTGSGGEEEHALLAGKGTGRTVPLSSARYCEGPHSGFLG